MYVQYTCTKTKYNKKARIFVNKASISVDKWKILWISQKHFETIETKHKLSKHLTKKLLYHVQ